MGEDQFKGIQVYDVIQDNKHNYIFATNEGLFKYNFVSFERLESPDAKSNSAFNFIKDQSGVIYCHNLNNQVFRIQDDVCALFYELKPEESGSDVSLAISDNGDLVIVSKSIIVLSGNGRIKKKKNDFKNYIGPPISLPDGELKYHICFSDSILSYKNGKFKIEALNVRANALKFFKMKNGYFAIDLKTKETYQFYPEKNSLTQLAKNDVFSRSQSVRIYENQYGVWTAGTLPGIFHLPNSIEKPIEKVLYDDYFISDVFVDHEGNTLLSTFDKGIIVIPDLEVDDVVNNFKDDPITTLYSFNSNELILGSSKGVLWSVKDSKLQLINNAGKRPIEVLFGDESKLIYDDGFIRTIDVKSKKIKDLMEASLKAGVSIGLGQFYLGTNKGVYKLKFNKGGGFEIIPEKDLTSRVHFMAYDSKNVLLYVSTADGLFVRSGSGLVRKVKYQKEDLYPLDMYYENGKVFLSTRDNGLLVYENGRFKRKILVYNEGKPLVLKKIIVHDEGIYASNSNGMYKLDLNGNIERSIHIQYGFNTKRVIDFTIHSGNLWVSHSGGVQMIDLSYKGERDAKLGLRFEKVLVNGKEVLLSGNGKLNEDQRKIQFIFTSPTLKYSKLIRYYYRLIGADTTWSSAMNIQNGVTYNALSSGSYEFQVRSEYQGGKSEIVSYKFKIDTPYYFKWWFIVICALATFGIIFLFYHRQLGIQNKKAELINELHASKLTAIQSQMNPHFIFNSLNSIQDLILKKDVQHSYSYITTFSNLVRRTLSYSEKDFIDFDQEIKLLEIYLSLEKLRFKQDFEYSIDTGDVDEIMLPPLLIQPFIENALVHGLLHKEGKKELKIKFKKEKVLICTIEDNGIGRDASKKIQQRQKGEHESFSSEAIRRRFEILSKVFGGEFGFKYEDLEENGKIAGTRVIMRIPIKEKF